MEPWQFQITLPDGRVVTHAYTPTPQQAEFHKANARYVLFGGAVGPGKSRALVEHILAKMIAWPGLPVLLLRHTLKALRASTEREWLKVCPPELYDPRYGGSHNKADHTYRLVNGSTLVLSGANDWEKHKSTEFGLIAIDELDQIDEDAYNNLDARLRWTTGEGICTLASCEQYGREHARHPRYQIVAATNPATGWVKRRFYVPWKEGNELPNHRFIRATTRDNPHLPADYLDTLMANRSAAWVQNYIEGEWSSFENQVFPDLSITEHSWPAERPLPPFAVVDGGIDWGSTDTRYAGRTACVLAGRTSDGTVIVFDLYSEQGPASKNVFDWIRAKTRQHRVRRWYADSSQERVGQLLRDQGLPIYNANRAPGAIADDIALITRWASSGRLYIHASLTRLWDNLESYRYGDNGKPAPHQADDEIDAFRYCLQSVTLGVTAAARSSSPHPSHERYSIQPYRPQARVSALMAEFRKAKREYYRLCLGDRNETN